MRGAPQPDHQNISVQQVNCNYPIATHVFSADLPPRFFRIQPFCGLVPLRSESHNYIALNRSQRTYLRRSGLAGHGSDSHFKRRAGGRCTIVRQLAVIQVALEEHEVRMGKVQE